jgi:hypothetical protein
MPTALSEDRVVPAEVAWIESIAADVLTMPALQANGARLNADCA